MALDFGQLLPVCVAFIYSTWEGRANVRIVNMVRRSIPAKLYRHLNKRKRINSLPGGYAGGVDLSHLDIDARILMTAALARDHRQAEKLMEKYNAETALDVFNALPKRRFATRWERFMDWLRRIEGTSEHDPLAAAMRDDQPEMRRRVKPVYRIGKEG